LHEKNVQMNAEQLYKQIIRKQSFLCIGLDTEPAKIPGHLNDLEFPLFEFNRKIIDATHDIVIAYKPNVAFYECLGVKGWQQFELTVRYIREHYPELLIIADAKRGDIGNSSAKYAETFFKHLDCDAVTVNPYMGSDSILPFLDYPGKWIILLALTSNSGADDFQFLDVGHNRRLFESVIQKTKDLGSADNTMFVVGATRASLLVKVREIIPDHFLLIPGVGAQGGDLEEVAEYGFNKNCGLIVNSSRAIIYADPTERFAERARDKALEMRNQMSRLLGKMK
jgi:orotidine-5'-phosphate decarboxylase